MKVKICFVVLILMLITSPFADTTYVSSIGGAETWDTTSSPYEVIDTINIAGRVLLTIEPGCEIILDGDFPFVIQDGGTFEALGTSRDSIVFKTKEGVPYWSGLDFINTPNCTLAYCKFIDANTDTTGSEGREIYGGAVFCDSSYLPINNCSFINNYASETGGAIYAGNSRVILKNCRFNANYSENSGGAIYSSHSRLELVNCLITNNHSQDGGACFFEFGSYKFVNCTISENTAVRGGGLCYSCASFTLMSNTILYGNQADSMNEVFIIPAYCGAPEISIYYSDVDSSECNTSAGSIVYQRGVIYTEALFRDSLDFHLSPSSPCIESGTVEMIVDTGTIFSDTIIDTATFPEHDIEGTTRPIGARCDMGAYESTCPGIKGEANSSLTQHTNFKTAPNPFETYCKIAIPNEFRNSCISVRDVNGNRVCELKSSKPTICWQPSKSLSSGLYIVSMRNKNQCISERVLYLKQ